MIIVAAKNASSDFDQAQESKCLNAPVLFLAVYEFRYILFHFKLKKIEGVVDYGSSQIDDDSGLPPRTLRN